MEIASTWVTCDGCGLPASPAHIAERVARLELATRFRPIHINVLFVSAAPSARREDDFYRPPESRDFFDAFLESVGVPCASATEGGVAMPGIDTARLIEFQRRGYYLSYLSECPIVAHSDDVSAALSRLGPTLVRRIRFNYKPRHVAILGNDLEPLRESLAKTGIASILIPSSELSASADAKARFKATLEGLSSAESAFMIDQDRQA